MELMIPATLELPATPLSLAELETRIVAFGHQVMREALRCAWAAQAPGRSDVPCPGCGSTARRAAGTKPRKLETRFGAVWLPRRRYRCLACARHFQPDDAVLRLALGGGRLSPGLREMVALCGVSWPYRQAADVVGRLRGTPLSPETVRAVVGTVGAAVAVTQARDAAAACAPAASTPPRRRSVPARVEVELDGAWVRAHDNRRGLEIKVGVVHAGSEQTGRTRRRLEQRRYAATAHGVDAFGPRVTAAIEHLNGYAAPTQVLLGDGAGWIWRLRDTILTEATPVLDRWHLHQARRRALRAAVPDPTQRASWRARLEGRLEVGDVPGALALLGDLAAIQPHPALTAFAAYLATLAPCIPDYAARRVAGERIGSGGVEKGVDLVANRRLKGRRGMRWWRERVEGLVALRVALLNEEWDRYVQPTLMLPAF